MGHWNKTYGHGEDSTKPIYICLFVMSVAWLAAEITNLAPSDCIELNLMSRDASSEHFSLVSAKSIANLCVGVDRESSWLSAKAVRYLRTTSTYIPCSSVIIDGLVIYC